MLLWLRCGSPISFNDEFLFAGAEGWRAKLLSLFVVSG